MNRREEHGCCSSVATTYKEENMNWTAVVITALICVTIAFLAAIGSDK